jgi:hypothetical protein
MGMFASIRTSFEVLRLTSGLPEVPQLKAARLAMRNISICRRGRYAPREAFERGLFLSGSGPSECDGFISRKTLTKLQEALNPAHVKSRFRNKAAFHRHCEEHSLPVPTLWGQFDAGAAHFWECSSGSPTRVVDQERFILTLLPERFAVKHVTGSHGIGFNIIHRDGTSFRDAYGKRYSAAELVRMLKTASASGLLIQEVLMNHPAIARLSGTSALQTCRLVTLIDQDGHSSIIYAFFKIIVLDDVVVDNCRGGQTGNFWAIIDRETGHLISAFSLPQNGTGAQPEPTHPKTGATFTGFQLPFWKQTCALVHRAAVTALPARTVGWDIAITAAGPVIVEGNLFWDPPWNTGLGPDIAAALKKVIAAEACRHQAVCSP